MTDSMPSKHADLLNALDNMQRSPAYAVRREVLARAEAVIVEQERQLSADRQPPAGEVRERITSLRNVATQIRDGKYVHGAMISQLMVDTAGLLARLAEPNLGPGTPLHRLQFIAELAEKYCGHSLTSSEPPEAAIARVLAEPKGEAVAELLRDIYKAAVNPFGDDIFPPGLMNRITDAIKLVTGMTDPEVFKLSAKACGQLVHTHFASQKLWIHYANGSQEEWNPFINADQRDLCRAELLKRGGEYAVTKTAFRWWETENSDTDGIVIYSDQPDKEGPARALAELELANR